MLRKVVVIDNNPCIGLDDGQDHDLVGPRRPFIQGATLGT